MRKRRLAFAMAVMMAFTSIPTSGLHVHAEEVIAEDLIIEDAEVSEELLSDSDEAVAADDELMVTDISSVEDTQSEGVDGEEVSDADVEESENTTAEETEKETEPVSEKETETEAVSEKEQQADDIMTDEFVMAIEEVQGVELQADEGTELPEATELTAGESYSVSVAQGEGQYFSFTPTEDTAGSYVMYSYDNTADTYVYLYQLQDGQMVLITTDDDNAGNNNNFLIGYKLEAGKTYYYKVCGYNNIAASCSIKFDHSPDVIGMTMEDAPNRDIFVYGVDDYLCYFSDYTVYITYSDGTYRGYSSGASMSDLYGIQISCDVYTTTETGTCGEIVSDPYNLQPGTYIRKISIEEYSYEYPMTVTTVSGLAGDNQIEVGSDFSTTFSYGTESIKAASFTTGDAGEYRFNISDGDYLGVFDETGTLIGCAVPRLSITLSAETKYYVVFRCQSDEEKAVTLSVNTAKTPQSVSLTDAATQVESYDVYKYLKSLTATVSYTEDYTEQVLTWECSSYCDDSGECIDFMFGYTKSSDMVYLKLKNSDGEYVSVPTYSGTLEKFLSTGNYTVELSLSGNADADVYEYSITVNGPEKTAVTLTESTDTQYNVSTDGYQWFAFTAEEAGTYVFDILYGAVDSMMGNSICPNSAVYKVDSGKISRDDSIVYATSYKGDVRRVSMEAGETCYLLLSGSVSNYGSATLRVEKKKEITALALESEANYRPIHVNGILRYLPVTISYADGSSETITWWSDTSGMSDENGNYITTAYTVSAENGDTVCMQLFDGNTVIALPDYQDYFLPGTYTIKVFVKENDTVCFEKTVTFEAVPENCDKLTLGTESAFNVSYDECDWYLLEIQKTDEYMFEVKADSYAYTVLLSLAEIGEDGLKTVFGSSCFGNLSYNAELKAGKTYAVLLEVNDTSAVMSGTIEVHRRKKVTGISFSQESWAYDFVNIAEGLKKFPITVTYDDGTSAVISDWQNDSFWDAENNRYSSLEGNAGDEQYIDLYLTDESGNIVDMPFLGAPSSIQLGSYRLNARMVSDSSITAQCKLNITDVEGTCSELEAGVTTSYSVSQNEKVLWSFNAVLNGKHTVNFANRADERANFLLYEITENQVTLLEWQNWIYNWHDTIFDAKAGSRYVICVSNEYSDMSGTMCVKKQKTVTGISLLQDSYEYSLMEAGEQLRSLQIEVTYDDGTSACISNWWNCGVWDENWNYYDGLRTDPGEEQYIQMILKKSDGTLVSVPGKDLYSSKVFGSYELVVQLESDASIADSAEITITGITVDMQEYQIGEALEITLRPGEEKILTFDSAQAGKYFLEWVRNSGGRLRSALYEVTENSLAYRAGGYVASSYRHSFNLEEGKTYVLWLQNQKKKTTASGSIFIREQRKVASISVPDISELDVFTAAVELKKPAITINYTDGTSEVIDSWWSSSDRDEDGNRYYRLCQYSEEGRRYSLYLQDAQGNSMDLRSWKEEYRPIGSYTLSVYEGYELTDAVWNFDITLPDAETLTDGDTKNITLSPDEYVIYAVTVEEGGYYFTADAEDAVVTIEPFSYNESKKTIKRITKKTGAVYVDLAEGTYYLKVGCTSAEVMNAPCTVCMTMVPTVESVELIAGDVSAELIEGLDKGMLTQLSAKITYSNGTEAIVKDYTSDSYGNKMRALFYAYNEDGTVNYESGFRTIEKAAAGTYFMAAVVTGGNGAVYRSGVPVQVISKEEAAQRNVISTDTNQITLTGKNTNYICISYTPEVSGYYLIKPDRYLNQIRLFNEKGEMDKQWVDDYTARVELTEGISYVIAVRADTAAEFSLDIELEKVIAEANVSYINGELVAGLDSFSDYDFIVDVDFGDGEIINLNGNDAYADGNGFRYEIVNTETGEIVDTYETLKAGTYQITAVQRTGSAVYRTSSAVYRTNSAIYRTGSAVDNNNSVVYRTESAVRSNPITVTVAALDANALTALEEETEYTLDVSAKRSLYAFTPQKDAVYILESDTGFTNWTFYELTETGMHAVCEQLTAGKTYIIAIPSIDCKQTVMITSELSELELDNTASGKVGAYDTVDMYFAPEETDAYQFRAEIPETDDDFSFSIVGYYSDSGTKDWPVEFTAYLTRSSIYHVRLSNYSDSEQSYLITAGREEAKEAKVLESFTVNEHAAEGYYAEYVKYYAEEDLFDITMKYTDGTSATYGLYESDPYGNYADRTTKTYVSSTDTSVTYRYDFRVGDAYQQIEVEFAKKGTEDYLKAGEMTKASLEGSRHQFYRFVPEKTGEYYFDIEGIHDYSLYFQNRNVNEVKYGVYKLQAGVSYLICIRSWNEDEIGTSYTVTPAEVNAVSKMELLTEAAPFIYGVQSVGSEMTAKVTYVDGMTAVISADMSLDAYGNEISVETRALANGRRRVYLQCGTGRVYCDVEAFDYSTLQQMKVNEYSWVNDVEGETTKLYLLSFVPEESGTYTYMFSTDGNVSFGPTFLLDVKNMKYSSSPAEVTAGRQYVFGMYVSKAECDRIGVAISNGATVCVEHSWDAGVVTKAATCCTDGERVYTCTACGKIKSEVLSADGTSHVFEEYKYNEDATCTENGTETAECTNGCGTVDTRTVEGSVLGHDWDDGEITAAATCCTVGEYTYICGRCKEIKTEVIPADGISHKFSKYTANGDATCTENGTETAVCAYGCGSTDIRNASQGALGHTYDAGMITKAATCCEKGELTYTCTRAECGHTYTEEIDPDGVSHTFSDYTYNEDASCSKDGTEMAVCANGCGASDTRTAEGTMKAHSFTQYNSNEDATCFADGTKTGVCDYEGCDVTDTLTDEGSKLEHVFENYQPDGNAACLSNGTETAECSNGCGVTHTRIAETGATGHSFTEYISDGNATCEADGTKTAKCDNCSATETVADEGSAAGHEYGDDWTVTKAATCTESGLKVRYCSHNCGEFESEVIPAIGHNYEDQPELTIEATEQTDGMIYQECVNDCGEINVIQVLVCTAEQDKINEVADIVNVEEGTAVDTASAVEQIQNISNQALIDSVETTDESGITTGVDGMKLVTDLEEQIKADTSDETPNVGDTSTVDGEGNEISNASAAGAAVTVAAAIQQNTSDEEDYSYQTDETYSAQLEITKVASAAAVMTAEDEEETADTGNVYVVDIHLNIVDSNNNVVATKVSLAAPIQVTMPVPKEVLDGQTKLYHLVGGEAVEVKFTSNGDGTITFYAPSFSEWSLEKEHHVAVWTVDKEATCTQTGLKHGFCIGCGQTVTAVIETVDHEYVTNITEATCCTAGEEYKECSGCQDKKTVKVIPATGEHSYSSEGVTVKAATCTENGTKRFACTTEGCSAYKEELILKGHSYDAEFTVDLEATCTTAGSKSIHCKNCDDKKNVTEIPAAGHTWTSEGTLTKDPTCTEEGEITYKCTNVGCDAEDTKAVKANGHSFSNAYTTDQEATCITAGSKSRHCANCDAVTDTKEIPATGVHNFVIETEEKQEPTCTEAGWIVYQCDTVGCTETHKVDLEAKDHEYLDFTIEKEASCSEDGSRSKYCINECGNKIGTEVIPATGEHDLQTVVDKEATCGEAGSQHVECKNCTYKEEATTIPATGEHDLQTVVDKEATCGEAGSQHVECKNCTYKEAATTIPATGKHALQTVVDKNATCGEAGSQHVECKNCTYKEAATTIPATGKHDLQTVVDKNATCGEAGSQHVECKNCIYKEAATAISATGKHDLKTVVDKAATCGEAGSQHVECKNCTYKEAATEIKATGKHSYGAYEVTKEATALAEGEEIRNCSICGHEDSKTVDKLKATIKLTTKSIPLQVKKSVNLKQVVTGLAEGDKIVSWSSSKKSVATVSKSGKVTAKKAGTTKITVTLASKKTATITVKVQKKAVKATKISNVKNVTLYLKAQKTFKLEPIVTPISTLDKITYTSSNKKIVTVSKKGVLTAKKKGKAKITIKCGSKKKTITVTVKK